MGQIFLIGAIVQSPPETGGDQPPAARVLYEMSTPASATVQSTALARTTGRRPKGAIRNAKPPVPPQEESTVVGVLLRDDDPLKRLEIDLTRPVQIERHTLQGPLLRLRCRPPLAALATGTMEELNRIFRKFSHFRAPKFSELLIYSPGRMGEPEVGSSPTGLFRISIPFMDQEGTFPLKNGESLADGVTYYTDRPTTKAGACDVHLLRVEPLNRNLSIVPVLANEGICQKEILSSMGRRYKALAGINGAYFTHRGDPIGTLIINRRLISSPLYNRSVFGLSTAGKPLFGNPSFVGNLSARGARVEIDAVNQPRSGDQLVIYTPEFARSTLTPEEGLELVLVKERVVGIHRRDTIIPPDGVVVSAGGAKAAALAQVRLGDLVTLDYRIREPWDNVQHGVCGGPRLLLDGKPSINGKEEKFDGSITSGRHPRTAVCQTFTGDLLFVVVDGRSKRSAGMTLADLASYLKRFGGRHAINLDGGGSSSMIVRGKIVNHPSDGKERPISNGIVITQN